MKAMVLLSGGLDSSTALAIAVDKHGAQNTIALCLSYGQKHEKELSSARAVAAHYGVELIETDVSYIFKYSNSSLLKGSDNEIPKESYAKQIEKTGGKAPVSTYVPFRNGLFLSVASSIALSRECDIIYYGAHADDAAGLFACL